jgi:hypothetical protein
MSYANAVTVVVISLILFIPVSILLILVSTAVTRFRKLCSNDPILMSWENNERKIDVLEHKLKDAQNQPSLDSDETRKVKSAILDLQCRSMKNNLVFTGLTFRSNENCEQKFRQILMSWTWSKIFYFLVVLTSLQDLPYLHTCFYLQINKWAELDSK